MIGLEFSAVLAMAGLGGPLSAEEAALLSLSLPDVEMMVVRGLQRESDE